MRAEEEGSFNYYQYYLFIFRVIQLGGRGKEEAVGFFKCFI